MAVTHVVGRRAFTHVNDAGARRRITDLHSRLHITAEQKPQWDQFTQVMRDNAKEMDEAYQQRAEKMGTMSAVDNMQSFAQIEQQRAQEMEKLVPAFQTLYASHPVGLLAIFSSLEYHVLVTIPLLVLSSTFHWLWPLA